MVYLFLAHCYAIVVAALVAVGPVAAWSNRKTSAEVSEQLCDPRAYHSIPQFPCPSCIIWSAHISWNSAILERVGHLNALVIRNVSFFFFLQMNLIFFISLLLC